MKSSQLLAGKTEKPESLVEINNLSTLLILPWFSHGDVIPKFTFWGSGWWGYLRSGLTEILLCLVSLVV